MRSVVLVGLMGAGKSTAGSLVAEATGRPFVDADATIVAQTGQTVRQLWEAGGEAAYRALESQVVLDTLARQPGAVLAAPGGVVLDPAVRARLVGSFVVWLRGDPATLATRVGRDDHRPLLGDDPREALSRMAQERSALYALVADLVVDSDRHEAAEVADIVLHALTVQTTDDR
jgi:shikimate kinase